MKRYIFATENEWKNKRLGVYTASEFHKLLAEPTAKEIKNGIELSKGAITYILEKKCELLAESEPSFYNAEMQRGNELEPQAVLAFANEMKVNVNDDDFIYTSENGRVFFTNDEGTMGGTPDIIWDDCIIEIKCPKSVTHLRYSMLRSAEEFKELHENYYCQMQINMYLCEKNYGVFVSFDDRFFAKEKQLFTLYIPYDENYINNVLTKLNQAINYANLIH